MTQYPTHKFMVWPKPTQWYCGWLFYLTQTNVLYVVWILVLAKPNLNWPMYTYQSIHLTPIFDKILVKLCTWKGFMLSIAGKLTLVKVITLNMINYTINIYSWLVALLRKFEQTCRNFIWSGDTHSRKLFMVSSKKTCHTYPKCGMSKRLLVKLNKATNLRLMWNMRTSKLSSAILLKKRYFNRKMSY